MKKQSKSKTDPKRIKKMPVNKKVSIPISSVQARKTMLYPLEPMYFDLARIVQTAIFLAYEFHKIYGPGRGYRMLLSALAREQSRESMLSHQIIYDNRLWGEDLDAVGHLMEIWIQMAPTVEVYRFRMDFRMDMFNGVRLVNDMDVEATIENSISVNVFKIEFDDELTKKKIPKRENIN